MDVSVFGGRDGDGTGAFQQATHLPHAQMYWTGVLLRSMISREQAEHDSTLSLETNVACKMNVFLMFWSSEASEIHFVFDIWAHAHIHYFLLK